MDESSTLAGLQAAPMTDMGNLERLAVAEAAEEAGFGAAGRAA